MAARDKSIELLWNKPEDDEEKMSRLSGYYLYYMFNNHTDQEKVLITQPVINYNLSNLSKYSIFEILIVYWKLKVDVC